ncbi:hypothetical protein LPJ64_005621 [Coemansia asiatica]|uniref:Uncharacterized protein n=1 Tax=Coemansia asiatica TaxID=1052880 RepID=A0A9W7XGV4_9FUNG|nr:hypothetical protein LPJ64_005621 [Coemansia asiatica]
MEQQPGSSFGHNTSVSNVGSQMRDNKSSNGTQGSSNNGTSGTESTNAQKSVLGDLNRFTTSQFADQLKHIGKVHPWYSLDEHQGIQ